MIRRLLLVLLLFPILLHNSLASENLEDSLMLAEKARLSAWSADDIDKAVLIERSAGGFGVLSEKYRGVASAVVPNLVLSMAYRTALGGLSFKLAIEDAVYRVVDNVGLVAGILVRTDSRAGSDDIERRIRYTATYLLKDGKWQYLQYHRSQLSGHDQ